MAEENKELVNQPEPAQQPTAETPAKPDQPAAPAHHVKIPVSVMKKWGVIIGGVVLILLFVVVAVQFTKKPVKKSSFPTVPKEEQTNVSAISEVPNLSFSIANEDELKKYLAQHAVFNGQYVRYLLNVPQKFVIVKKMIFKLVPTDQQYFKMIDPQKKTVLSYGQAYDQTTQAMTLSLYMSPDLLKQLPDNTKLTEFVTRSFASLIYRITVGRGVKTVDESQVELIKSLKAAQDVDKYQQLLIVKRK